MPRLGGWDGHGLPDAGGRRLGESSNTDMMCANLLMDSLLDNTHAPVGWLGRAWVIGPGATPG